MRLKQMQIKKDRRILYEFYKMAMKGIWE
ncbi:MAG: hypothetical protein ACD_79C00685G0001, partial [uncultured bacterium]